jgi:FkbM family methyltransferase
MLSGFVRPFVNGPGRHVLNLVSKPAYRTYCRLESRYRHIPRFQEFRASVHGWDLRVPDSASFLSTYRDLFLEEHYSFPSLRPDPLILDVGANIGLGVLYFKRLYPAARITAFEADPRIFACLAHNVHGNGFSDVELIDKAAWVENTTLTFHSEGGDGGFVGGGSGAGDLQVGAVDLAAHLAGRHIDLLKLDIEGSETRVLPACAPYLSQVERLFVEYHSPARAKQSLDQLVSVLAGAGFRLFMQNVNPRASPFQRPMGSARDDRFDLQLDIFAFRDS